MRNFLGFGLETLQGISAAAVVEEWLECYFWGTVCGESQGWGRDRLVEIFRAVNIVLHLGVFYEPLTFVHFGLNSLFI